MDKRLLSLLQRHSVGVVGYSELGVAPYPDGGGAWAEGERCWVRLSSSLRAANDH